jgi:hypothetical protein
MDDILSTRSLTDQDAPHAAYGYEERIAEDGFDSAVCGSGWIEPAASYDRVGLQMTAVWGD